MLMLKDSLSEGILQRHLFSESCFSNTVRTCKFHKVSFQFLVSLKLEQLLVLFLIVSTVLFYFILLLLLLIRGVLYFLFKNFLLCHMLCRLSQKHLLECNTLFACTEVELVISFVADLCSFVLYRFNNLLLLRGPVGLI